MPAAAQNDWRHQVLRQALAYARIGWRLVPCERGTKLPLLVGWTTRATSSEHEVRRWFERWPRGVNIAVATGPASGLVVLDVDVLDGVDGTQRMLDLVGEGLVVPQTATQLTGSGGRQYFLRYPDVTTPLGNTAGRLGRGIDTRGVGGLAILPPSLHPNGRLYSWCQGADPWSLRLAAPPDWLLEALMERASRRASSDRCFENDDDRYVAAAVTGVIKDVASAVPGERNSQLYAGCRRLLDLGLPPHTVAQALATAALSAGLNCRETGRTIDSACRGAESS
jgi:hypothetical protein